ELDFHSVDRREAACFFDLADGDVTEADPFDQTLARERAERSDAGRQRHPRIWRMQEVPRQPIDVERTEACLARGADVPRASIRYPAAFRARQTALGRHLDAASVAVPARERPGDEALVMVDFAVVPAVGVGRVD